MNTNIFATQDKQINAIIQEFSTSIKKVISTKGHATIAVSGGKSPITLFAKLCNLDLPWDKITITLVDERIVPANNSDSNENLVRTHLLKSNAQKAKFIGIISNFNDISKSIENLNKDIIAIDLAILGMGEDGHTASIFPDCPELKQALETKEQYLLTNPISAKYQRISLSLHALKNIHTLILNISGEIKLNVIKEAILGKNLNYPISYLLHARNDIKAYWHA